MRQYKVRSALVLLFLTGCTGANPTNPSSSTQYTPQKSQSAEDLSSPQSKSENAVPPSSVHKVFAGWPDRVCTTGPNGAAKCYQILDTKPGHDSGMGEVGFREIFKESLSQLKNPSQFSMAPYGSCVLSDDGVNCFGVSPPHNRLKVPDLDHPTWVGAGGCHACALTRQGLNCWAALDVCKTLNLGNNPYKGQAEVPTNLGTISEVAVGHEHTCVIADGKVQSGETMSTGRRRFRRIWFTLARLQ